MHEIPPPYLVSYAITRKCNLKCKHCYSDALDVAAPDELSTSEAKKLLDTIADWGIHLLIFDGGEPLYRDDLVQVPMIRNDCPGEILSNMERKNVTEWLAEAQRDCPIVIRTPGCPMYPLILKQKNVQPKHFPPHLLRRIPYYDRGCAAGMPNGYTTILPNGDVIPCMLLQTKLGNAWEENVVKIWEESPILAKLR